MFLKKDKKEPPKYYVWVLLGIIVFGLILWVWQWWQARLPEDPKKAVAEVTAKMDKIKSVDLQITHVLSAPDSEAVEVSAQVELKLPDEYQGKMKITGPDSFLKDLPFSAERDFARIQHKEYTRDQGQADWVDQSVDPDYVPFLKIEPLSFLDFSLDNADIAREKDETIAGTNYAVYSFGYSREKLAEALKPFSLLIDEIPAESEVRGQIWFNPKTRLLYQQKVSVLLPGLGGEEATTVFSDYDGMVMMTPMDKIVSATPADSGQTNQEGSQEREERNQKRQVDLLAIKAALEKIYDDEHVYPESAESANIGDDQSEVHQKLLKYLKEVPADPQAPKYYYAYKCTGGEQFELTGIQESEAGSPKVIMLTQGFDYFKDK